MEAEHCSMGGYAHRFETITKKITWPANEWAITVRGNHLLAHVDPSSSRKLQTISELMEHVVVKQAKLRICEVAAVALYTGPMVTENEP